jgi:hypothetical protein
VFFRSLSKGWTVLLLVAAVAGGCEQRPKPFAPENKAAILESTFQASPRVGLLVDAVDGLNSDTEALRFRTMLAEALQGHDFTASAQSAHHRSARLTGYLIWAAVSPNATRVAGHWRVESADGEELLVTDHITDIPLPLARAQDGSALPQIAADAATTIDLGLNRQENETNRRLALAPVSIGTIDGLPEHDSRSLNRALVQALSSAGIPVTAIPPDNGFVLLGEIRLQPRGPGSERMDVVWQLIRPNGEEVGRIDQANILPSKRILYEWSSISSDIAAGVVSGIVDLQRQVAGKSP